MEMLCQLIVNSKAFFVSTIKIRHMIFSVHACILVCALNTSIVSSFLFVSISAGCV